jgi:hypothetical protein
MMGQIIRYAYVLIKSHVAHTGENLLEITQLPLFKMYNNTVRLGSHWQRVQILLMYKLRSLRINSVSIKSVMYKLCHI